MCTALVTGGAGYFGERLTEFLLRDGYTVRVLDLNPPAISHPNIEPLIGDIRDREVLRRACENVSLVFHNVAQVPLAKDIDSFWSVNRDGTRNLLDECLEAGVVKVVYTSSSAVYGAPKHNPVNEDSPPDPREDYGRAKLAGERLCADAHEKGLDVAIVRPRTILGHGRLGVVQILFDWIARGMDVPVFGGGRNVYQFVHADDLARACIAASHVSGFRSFNIGAETFGTMHQTLATLIAHARSPSQIRSVPMGPAAILGNFLSTVGLSPLGPYHSLMYGRSLYFDVTRAKRELGWKAEYSNADMICESYDWYMSNRANLAVSDGRSHHQSRVRKGALSVLPFVLKTFPRV